MDTPIISPVKRCGKCHEEKPYSKFHVAKGKPDGRFLYCKECRQSDSARAREQDRLSWPAGTRRCTHCHIIKPETYEFFVLVNRASSGFCSRCRDCQLKSAKERYAKNPEPHKERSRKYASENPEKVKAAQRAYARANRDKFNQWSSNYVARNKDKHRIANRNAKRKNPKLQSVMNQRARARRLSLPNSFTTTQWSRAIEYFKGHCAVCGRPFKDLFGGHTVAGDHWIPISSPDCPGTVVENMVPLCHGEDGCNNSKGAKDAPLWLEKRFRKKKAKQILARITAYFEWAKQQD